MLASASFSSLVFLGGRAGRDAESNSGARTVCLSDLDVIEILLDIVDNDDLAVAMELTDSLLPRRLNAMSDGRLLCTEGTSEGRLGGSAGEAAG